MNMKGSIELIGENEAEKRGLKYDQTNECSYLFDVTPRPDGSTIHVIPIGTYQTCISGGERSLATRMKDVVVDL